MTLIIMFFPLCLFFVSSVHVYGTEIDNRMNGYFGDNMPCQPNSFFYSYMILYIILLMYVVSDTVG